MFYVFKILVVEKLPNSVLEQQHMVSIEYFGYHVWTIINTLGLTCREGFYLDYSTNIMISFYFFCSLGLI